MTQDLSFGGCLNNIRNIRNNFYGHLTNYLIEFKDYVRIIDIFDKVIQNLPNLEENFKDQIKKSIKLTLNNAEITTNRKINEIVYRKNK